MLRKLLHILVWLLVLAYLGVALAFTEKMDKGRKVKYVQVEFMDSAKSQLLNREEVLSRIEKFGHKLDMMPADSINMSGIEMVVNDISEVKTARVFFTPDDILHIRIWQREPIVRIISGNSQYYLDDEGAIIEFTDRFTPKVLVITGSIKADYALEKLYGLAMFVREDPFYSALIQEIHVDPKQNLEIIPRIGKQRIFFGPSEEYEWKFTKLKAFYDEALPNTGWDRYSSIDLRYSNQVVCKKIK